MIALGPAPSRLRAAFVVIRDAHANGATAGEIAATMDGHAHQVVVPLAWLERHGEIVRVGYRAAHVGGWPDPVYVTARIASYLGPACGRTRG